MPTLTYHTMRLHVLNAAAAGRCTMIPAGARHNETARILIDGTDIGEATTLTGWVREDPTQNHTTFGERRMAPAPDWAIPPHVRAQAAHLNTDTCTAHDIAQEGPQ